MRERGRQLVKLAVVDVGMLLWLALLVAGCSAHRPPCVACPCPSPAPTPTPTPTPTPAPPPSGCTFPQGVPDAEFIEVPSIPAQTEVDVVNAAIAAVGYCNVGSDCPLGTDPQAAQQRIIQELRRRGVCAGQHRNGETDEGAVTIFGCASLWNGYHWVNYPTNPGDQSKAVWARVPSQPCMGNACVNYGGQSYRGAWQIPAAYCGGRPGRRR